MTQGVALALFGRKCQSNEVDAVTVNDDGSIRVSDGGDTVIWTSRRVSAPDGSTIEHESRGGSIASAWACRVGRLFVEVSHLGHGPIGGELALVVSDPDTGESVVALGDLVTTELPAEVPDSWPVAVDLAIGLVTDRTLDSGSKDDIEDFHQRLLGAIHPHTGYVPPSDHITGFDG